MQRAARIRQALDSDQLVPIDSRQEANTRVDGPIHNASAIRRKLAEHHGAGAAIAFGATLFGSSALRYIS
jgi:hypothetical protein